MRLDNFSIGTRLTAGMIGILLLTVVLIAPFLLIRMDDIVDQAEQRELNAFHGNFEAMLKAESRTALNMSALVSGIPVVQKAFAKRNRDLLERFFLPGQARLTDAYGVNQFQFHTPPATSFYRVHRPEKFGDDLSQARPTILETNRQQHAVQGLDSGVFGIGIRGLVPMEYEGEHTGSVEFGMRFDASMFARFKATYGVDIAVYLREDNGQYTTFGSTHETPLLSDTGLEQAFAGTPVLQHASLEGQPVSAMGQVLRNYAGEPIGVVEIAMDRRDYLATERSAILTTVGLSLLALLIGAGLALLLGRTISRPVKRTSQAMRDIAEGDGDLTRRLDDTAKDEIGELARHFNAFAHRMQKTLLSVRDSAHSVNEEASEVARDSEKLASSTEQTAANLQQTSASMEEISATVKHSLESSEQANTLAQGAARIAREGRTSMQQVESTMQDLNTSSGQIRDIISMIDSIAFQTNILALNASVEAARAGEHGRGFAVVAEEVRKLASRSSDSAQEIRDLIDTSVKGTQTGSELVTKTSETMDKILESITQVSDVVAEITASSREQSTGINQVNTAVTELDTATQENASMVQQFSHVASTMDQHASHLEALVTAFKLDDGTLPLPKQQSAGARLRSIPASQSAPDRHQDSDDWETF